MQSTHNIHCVLVQEDELFRAAVCPVKWLFVWMVLNFTRVVGVGLNQASAEHSTTLLNVCLADGGKVWM